VFNCRFRKRQQVSSLVDTLRNEGFDRKDMLFSDLAEDQQYRTVEEAAKKIAFVKTEREGLGKIKTFADGVKGLRSRQGIIVAVEMPKNESDRVRSFMRLIGAEEIIQDQRRQMQRRARLLQNPAKLIKIELCPSRVVELAQG
jgi:hypothetical protein